MDSSESPDSTELSIVIPFFNEELNVGIVIRAIQELLVNEKIFFEIVAVNNGSSDKTGQIIKDICHLDSRIKLIQVPINKGYGYGILQGMNHTSGQYVGYIDGDGQIDAEALIGCYKELKISPELELAKGIPRKIGGSSWRQYLSKFYNLIIGSLFRIEAYGINCKPKIFTRTLYERLNLESKDWFIDAEIMIKCTRLNVRYVEYPIKVLSRMRGHSSVSFRTVLEFLMNFVRYFFFK